MTWMSVNSSRCHSSRPDCLLVTTLYHYFCLFFSLVSSPGRPCADMHGFLQTQAEESEVNPRSSTSTAMQAFRANDDDHHHIVRQFS
uniref:Secreted protein n=1 Tax=Panagrellus redivivus TaxID=6233 RepID=A0A7E5A128_PANRE